MFDSFEFVGFWTKQHRLSRISFQFAALSICGECSAWATRVGTELRWQEQLPPKARKVVEFSQECVRVWNSIFPPKSEEQKQLEAQIRKAVLNGDLHWSALNRVQQGKPILPEQIAEAKRLAH
jgi:hypothetical protein